MTSLDMLPVLMDMGDVLMEPDKSVLERAALTMGPLPLADDLIEKETEALAVAVALRPGENSEALTQPMNTEDPTLTSFFTDAWASIAGDNGVQDIEVEEAQARTLFSPLLRSLQGTKSSENAAAAAAAVAVAVGGFGGPDIDHDVKWHPGLGPPPSATTLTRFLRHSGLQGFQAAAGWSATTGADGQLENQSSGSPAQPALDVLFTQLSLTGQSSYLNHHGRQGTIAQGNQPTKATHEAAFHSVHQQPQSGAVWDQTLSPAALILGKSTTSNVTDPNDIRQQHAEGVLAGAHLHQIQSFGMPLGSVTANSGPQGIMLIPSVENGQSAVHGQQQHTLPIQGHQHPTANVDCQPGYSATTRQLNGFGGVRRDRREARMASGQVANAEDDLQRLIQMRTAALRNQNRNPLLYASPLPLSAQRSRAATCRQHLLSAIGRPDGPIANGAAAQNGQTPEGLSGGALIPTARLGSGRPNVPNALGVLANGANDVSPLATLGPQCADGLPTGARAGAAQAMPPGPGSGSTFEQEIPVMSGSTSVNRLFG